MPKVSVILPSYNHEPYLPQTIKSILGQSFADFELIIIDDFSQDKSREIIEDFKKKDERISYHFHKANQGIAFSLNEGIGLARGEYIAYCSSDDIWERERLKTGLEAMEKHPEIGFLHSEALVIDSEGKPTGKRFSSLYPSPTGSYSGDLFQVLLQRNIICGSSILFRKSASLGLSFSEELKYLNDWLYYLEFSERSRFYYLPQPLVRYRVHGGNTWLDSQGYAKDYLLLLKIIGEKYPEIKEKGEILAELYCDAGYFLCLSGEVREGRGYLLQALKSQPFKLKPLLLALLSMPGSKFFRTAVRLRNTFKKP